MLHVLSFPLPWYVVGPGMGLTVTAMYAVTNKHLGISGSYVQFVDGARGRPLEFWRFWFLAGLLLGGALVGVLGANQQSGFHYGLLGQLLPAGTLVPVLFVGGVLLGFGARWAGACTSGHGITGCSTRSPGSMTAIATFMAAAVAFTYLLHATTGGAL